jgi:hypothetical protein
MHGLPMFFRPSVFEGLRVDGVGFFEFVINVWFDDDVTILIMGKFLHGVPGEESAPQNEQPPVRTSRLMRIAGRTVARAEVVRPGTLILRFDDGQSLTLFDDDPYSESYNLFIRDRTVVV